MGRLLESEWGVAVLTVCFGIAVIGVGCGGEGVDQSSRGFRVEGTEAGDCEDNADNDADGLFDCDDPGCAGASVCAAEVDGGTGGAGGTEGGGGAGGSLLCADVDCDDQNECSTDACDPVDGECDYTLVTDGMTCDFGGLPGVCGAGACEDAMLCAGVDCDDQNECTTDTCNPTDGECAHTSITDGTSCDFGGLPGVCGAGVCEDAMLCSGVDCDDGNECTQDGCDPMDGQCGYADVMDGTTCDFVGLPGVCTAGTCATEPCVTNALCHTCPSSFLCNTDDDCTFSGYVCVASGCATNGGDPIKQCVPAWAGSCSSDTDCPNQSDYDCLTVGVGGKRCVRVTTGCTPATETYDCAPGFSCEGGTCVDRRMPCDSYGDCPKSHICLMTPASKYCTRVSRTCHVDADCSWLGNALGSFCADVDADGVDECTGERDATGAACVSADCGSSSVCESGAVGSLATCGDYGLCRFNSDCGSGFECLGLWQDGRKECVPSGGSCGQVTDCSVQQVCAAPRSGGPPSCQAGSAP